MFNHRNWTSNRDLFRGFFGIFKRNRAEQSVEVPIPAGANRRELKSAFTSKGVFRGSGLLVDVTRPSTSASHVTRNKNAEYKISSCWLKTVALLLYTLFSVAYLEYVTWEEGFSIGMAT